MITKRLDRRTAIATLVGALITAGASWRLGAPSEAPSPTTQWPPAYVAPTTWANLTATSEQLYLSWDQTIWTLEINGQQHQALNFVASLLGTQGNDVAKRQVSFFVRTSLRPYLYEGVVAALNPTKTNATSRYSILSDLLETMHAQGVSVIPSNVRDTLRAYHDSGAETDPKAKAILHRIHAFL